MVLNPLLSPEQEAASPVVRKSFMGFPLLSLRSHERASVWQNGEYSGIRRAIDLKRGVGFAHVISLEVLPPDPP